MTQTDVVQGSETNTCGDRISGQSGWYSLLAPDQIGTLPAEAYGSATYEVFAFPPGWGTISSDQYVFGSPPYYEKDIDGVLVQAPLVMTFPTGPRAALTPPVDQSPLYIYTSVAFDEAVSPAAPVGSTLGIGVPGKVELRKLTVVDCTPPPPSYTFTGFGAPVDNGGVINVAKAGSAIPLKFRVTDANGNGVTGLTSPPVAVSSSGGPCLGGAVTDEIEQYAGGSGLQDQGNGYYQFNWKTPKTYKGHCRTLMVSLGDGNQTHTAEFQFK